jgi:hypothetical protein
MFFITGNVLIANNVVYDWNSGLLLIMLFMTFLLPNSQKHLHKHLHILGNM